MTNEMVKRVARSIHDELENDDDSEGGGYARAARAAIAAMREPTEAMVGAGWDVRTRDSLVGYAAQNTWQAMIDAALS